MKAETERPLVSADTEGPDWPRPLDMGDGPQSFEFAGTIHVDRDDDRVLLMDDAEAIAMSFAAALRRHVGRDDDLGGRVRIVIEPLL